MPDPLKQSIASRITDYNIRRTTLSECVELLANDFKEYTPLYCEHNVTPGYDAGWKDAIHFAIGMIEESNKYHKNIAEALIKTVKEMPVSNDTTTSL